VKCTNKLVKIVILIIVASLFTACSKESAEIWMPFSTYVEEETNNIHSEFTTETTVKGFSSDLCVFCKHQIRNREGGAQRQRCRYAGCSSVELHEVKQHKTKPPGISQEREVPGGLFVFVSNDAAILWISLTHTQHRPPNKQRSGGNRLQRIAQ